MNIQPITQDIIINKIDKTLSKLSDTEYVLSKTDYMILEIGFFRLRNHLFTKKKQSYMNGSELFWDIVIGFEPMITHAEFLSIVNCYRSDKPHINDFTKNEIDLFMEHQT